MIVHNRRLLASWSLLAPHPRRGSTELLWIDRRAPCIQRRPGGTWDQHSKAGAMITPAVRSGRPVLSCDQPAAGRTHCGCVAQRLSEGLSGGSKATAPSLVSNPVDRPPPSFAAEPACCRVLQRSCEHARDSPGSEDAPAEPLHGRDERPPISLFSAPRSDRAARPVSTGTSTPLPR